MLAPRTPRRNSRNNREKTVPESRFADNFEEMVSNPIIIYMEPLFYSVETILADAVLNAVKPKISCATSQ
jgi:hypothetical protein